MKKIKSVLQWLLHWLVECPIGLVYWLLFDTQGNVALAAIVMAVICGAVFILAT